MTQPNTESRLRTALLGLTGLMFAGTPVELLLADHTAETNQFIPFVTCALAAAAIAAVLMRPQRVTVMVARAVMLLNIGGGLLGMGLHLAGNYAFESEIRSNAAAGELILETLKGVNPLLAPGMLVFMAVVVLIALYGHPAANPQP